MSSDAIPFSPSTTRPKESQKLEILGGLKKLQDRVGERKLEEFRSGLRSRHLEIYPRVEFADRD